MKVTKITCLEVNARNDIEHYDLYPFDLSPEELFDLRVLAEKAELLDGPPVGQPADHQPADYRNATTGSVAVLMQTAGGTKVATFSLEDVPEDVANLVAFTKDHCSQRRDFCETGSTSTLSEPTDRARATIDRGDSRESKRRSSRTVTGDQYDADKRTFSAPRGH